MGYLKIKNKKDFVSNFLVPVSNLNDVCVISINNNIMSCILSSPDDTIVCKTTFEVETDVNDTKLNIPDIRKLTKVLEIIPSDEIELKINNNNISYSKDGYKFKYHLLDDGIIKQPTLNFDKIKKIKFDTKFKVEEKNLNTLFKGSSFATETSKVYFFEDENKICSELGDRSRHNSDNFVCELSDTYEGNINKPLPVNFESFRLISFGNCGEVSFNVNTDIGVITCTFNKGHTNLIYIISALIN